MQDGTLRATAPVTPGPVESPSSERTKKKKVEAGTEVLPDDLAEPSRGVSPLRRRAATMGEGGEANPGEFYEGSCNDDEDWCCRRAAWRGFLSQRFWVRSEALLWWVKGGETPPLLTTSAGTGPQNQSGALGQSDTSVIFGDQELNTGLHPGGRISFGLWMDRCEESGLELSYMLLASNTQTYDNPSDGTPILARPFFDVTGGSQSRMLIAYPNFANGIFNASSTENLQGAEALWRKAVVHGEDGRIDLLLGYRFQRLTDGLQINDLSSNTTGDIKTTANVSDTFHTVNDFNGSVIGLSTRWHRTRWSLDTALKLGIGETHSQVFIGGVTDLATTRVSTGAAISDVRYPGGLLALTSNSGYHDSEQFSVMPEISFTLGYDLTPRLRATAGYTLLYWSAVARPGDQIDLNVDTTQLPGPNQVATGNKPVFDLHTSELWAQGVNLGLDFRF